MTTDTFAALCRQYGIESTDLTDECAGETTQIFFAHPPIFATPAEEDTGETEDGAATDPTRTDT